MGYRKLSTNKYKITTELGYDIFGKRIRKTEIFYGTGKEAKIRDAELTKKYYKKSNNANIKDMNFEQYSQVFLKRYCEENVSPITTKGYKTMLKKVNSLIGKYKLDKITTYTLDCMYQKIRTSNPNKTLSAESMLHYKRLINVMFVQAVKWKLLNENPNENTKKIKKEKSNNNFYDYEQVKYLLQCIENEDIKTKTLITLAIDSGARRSEICALIWDDINFDTNEITIDNSLKVIEGKVDELGAKTSYSIRKIYVSDKTMDLLRQYRDWQDNFIEEVGDKWHDENRVFTAKNGKHIHPDTCSKMFNKIVKKYNLPQNTFHGLRHTSASLLLAEGINIKAVSQRLGHSSPNITMEVYSHAFDTTKKESAEKIDKILKNI